MALRARIESYFLKYCTAGYARIQDMVVVDGYLYILKTSILSTEYDEPQGYLVEVYYSKGKLFVINGISPLIAQPTTIRECNFSPQAYYPVDVRESPVAYKN